VLLGDRQLPACPPISDLDEEGHEHLADGVLDRQVREDGIEDAVKQRLVEPSHSVHQLGDEVVRGGRRGHGL